jgi:hypothetical protein
VPSDQLLNKTRCQPLPPPEKGAIQELDSLTDQIDVLSGMWIGQTQRITTCQHGFQALIQWRRAVIEKYGDDVQVERLPDEDPESEPD